MKRAVPVGLLGLAIVGLGAMVHAVKGRQFPKSTTAPQEDIQQSSMTPEDGGLIPGVQVRDYLLRFTSSEGRCSVLFTSPTQRGKLLLGMAPPCNVVLDYQGAPRISAYGQNIKTWVAVVVGGAPAAEGAMDPVLKIPCGTQIQGILIQEGRIEASRQVFDGNAFCPGAGMDEKIYRMFSGDDPKRSQH
ncbi:MAG TPA: hypothetical protein VF697_27515 [Archangium sp.]